MAYVPVPKDLTKIKTKVFLNLTLRQLLCFSLAALVGVPLFFILKSQMNLNMATLLLIFICLPFFLFAIYEQNGQPLEIALKCFIQARFLRAKRRPYRTRNLYHAVHRQIQLNKEVRNIVATTETYKAHTHKAH